MLVRLEMLRLGADFVKPIKKIMKGKSIVDDDEDNKNDEYINIVIIITITMIVIIINLS